MKIFFYIGLLSCLLWSCNGRVVKSRDNFADSLFVELNAYWTGYKFTSNEISDIPNRIEQSLVDYIAQFSNYPTAEVIQSLQFLISQTERDSVFFFFIKDKLTNYLYHPNSPMRNDYYYEEVLKVYQSSSLVSERDKLRDKIVLDLVSRNQIGTKAANFQFENRDGGISSLESYGPIMKLLIFYDPSCLHCNDVIKEMKNSEVLNRIISANKIKVIAVDPLGDYGLWKKYSHNIPVDWVNGFDQDQRILHKSIYNIQAYPTIYMINANNIVVLKDVYFFHVEKYLLNFG